MKIINRILAGVVLTAVGLLLRVSVRLLATALDQEPAVDGPAPAASGPQS